jgi:hypothetical protein
MRQACIEEGHELSSLTCPVAGGRSGQPANPTPRHAEQPLPCRLLDDHLSPSWRQFAGVENTELSFNTRISTYS